MKLTPAETGATRKNARSPWNPNGGRRSGGPILRPETRASQPETLKKGPNKAKFSLLGKDFFIWLLALGASMAYAAFAEEIRAGPDSHRLVATG